MIVADHVTLRFRTDDDTSLPTATNGEIVGEAEDGSEVQALILSVAGAADPGDGSHFHELVAGRKQKNKGE